MIKRVVLHDLDYNWLAPCKEWYYKAHAPQIVRRYGPWLARFESFRPAPFPAGARGEEHGYTNWLCTVGCWRKLPGRWRPGDTCLSDASCELCPRVSALSIFLGA